MTIKKSKKNLILTAEALDIVAEYGKRISKATLIKWARVHNLGHQYVPGSHWLIDKNKLVRLLEKEKM